MSVTISGTGVFTPSQKISNKELVQSYNKYADSHNEKHKIRKDIYRINCNQLTNKLKVGYKKHILIFLGHCADLVQCSTSIP